MQLAPVFIVNSIRLAHDHPLGNPEQSRFQNHIFEPFTQETGGARSVYGGTGLGMPITKKLLYMVFITADSIQHSRQMSFQDGQWCFQFMGCCREKVYPLSF